MIRDYARVVPQHRLAFLTLHLPTSFSHQLIFLQPVRLGVSITRVEYMMDKMLLFLKICLACETVGRFSSIIIVVYIKMMNVERVERVKFALTTVALEENVRVVDEMLMFNQFLHVHEFSITQIAFAW
jgi:hypothetical protein